MYFCFNTERSAQKWSPNSLLVGRSWGKLLLVTLASRLKSLNVKVMLRPTVSRPVFLGVSHPSRAHDHIFITVRRIRVCWCWAPSLTIGRAYSSEKLLGLVRAVNLGSESRRTHDHILMSQIWDSLNLEGQVSKFISHRIRVAQLYPQTLGFTP
jgi:hypothetical protein